MAAFIQVGVGSGARRHGAPAVSGRRAGSFARATVKVRKVPELTDPEFEELVLKSDAPVLVDFYAKWCGPCKMVSPLVDWAGSTYRDDLKVFKMDIDKQPDTVKKFEIQALPHLVMFKEGEDISHVTGLITKAQLVKNLEEKLGI